MIRLVRVELLKIRSTRLWIGLLIPALGLAALGAILRFALAGSEETGLTEIRTVDDVRDIVLSGSIVGAFAIVLGAVAATSEHRYSTLAGTFLATPARRLVVIAKCIAAGIVGAGIGLLGAALPLLISVVWLVARGDGVPFGRPVVFAVVSVTGESAYAALLGAGVGAAVRSQLVGILAPLAWVLVAEPLGTALLPEIARWTPFTGADGLFGQMSAGTLELFGPLGALALIAAYVVGVVGAGIWVTERADVG